MRDIKKHNLPHKILQTMVNHLPGEKIGKSVGLDKILQ
jgi:hypothetical protein